MKPQSLSYFACPACLSSLELTIKKESLNGIEEGELHCDPCGIAYSIHQNIPFFGLDAENVLERQKEMAGEMEWVSDLNDLDTHLQFAKGSAKLSETLLKTIEAARPILKNQEPPRLLDVGAGWGCFQSWRFAKAGYQVVATELLPEFLISSEKPCQDQFFERVATDVTLLPFADESFDVVICKEIVHHINQPKRFFNELLRITKRAGFVLISEPCRPIYKSLKSMEEGGKDHNLTHYIYTFSEYLRFVGIAAQEIKWEGTIRRINSKNHPLVSRMQDLLLRLQKQFRMQKILFPLMLQLFGGEIQMYGRRRQKQSLPRANRKIILIPLDSLDQNCNAIAFYRDILVPKVFDVFLAALPDSKAEQKMVS